MVEEEVALSLERGSRRHSTAPALSRLRTGTFIFLVNMEYLLKSTSGTEASSASEVIAEADSDESDGNTSSEEDDANKTTTRPYNVLLQSLKPASGSGLPVSKKRRVERGSSTNREIEEASTSDLIEDTDNKEAIEVMDEPEEEDGARAEESDEELEDEGIEDDGTTSTLFVLLGC